MESAERVAGAEAGGHVTSLLGVYSLGVLETGELDRVERHLSTCLVCQQEATAYHEAAASLAFAAPAAMPPSALKGRLLSRVTADRDSVAAPRRPLVALPATQIPARPTPPARRPGWLWPALATAALFMVAILGSGYLALQRQVDDQKHAVAALWSQVEGQRGAMARLQVMATQVTMAQAAPLTTIHMLRGTGAASEALGTLVIGPRTPLGFVIVHNLPTSRIGVAFDCWLIAPDGTRTFVGTVVANRQGDGYMPVKAPRDLSAYRSFGVTARSGSSQNVLWGPMTTQNF